jgi:hypothetical protein
MLYLKRHKRQKSMKKKTRKNWRIRRRRISKNRNIDYSNNYDFILTLTIWRVAVMNTFYDLRSIVLLASSKKLNCIAPTFFQCIWESFASWHLEWLDIKCSTCERSPFDGSARLILLVSLSVLAQYYAYYWHKIFRLL